MSFYDQGPLVRLDGKINAQSYVDMLQEFMLPEFQVLKQLDIAVFQQDNAPWHKAKLTTAWFSANEIDVLKWPACSPDLSLIEDVWAIIVGRIRKMDLPKSKLLMVEKIFELWDDFDQETIIKLVKSFKSRLEKVIEGDLIKKFYF